MTIEFPRGEQLPDGGLIADRDLYLDKTETRIVEEGDPASAFQFTGKGRVIPPEDAARLGLELVDGKVVQRGAAVPAVATEAPVAEGPVAAASWGEPPAAAADSPDGQTDPGEGAE